MLTPPLLLADYAGYIDVSDRSEIQFRSTQQLTNPAIAQPADAAGGAAQTVPQAAPVVLGPAQLGLDLFTQPQLRIRMTNRRWEYTFGYLPSLTITDLQRGSGGEIQVLQEGQVGAAWHPDRHVTLAINEDATYGRFNSANLVPTVPTVAAGTPTQGAEPPGTQTPAGAAGTTAPVAPMTGTTVAPLQAQPKPATITLLTTRTTADVFIQSDRRTRVTLEGGYYATGGLGQDALNVVLPEQYGPTASAAVAYALTRRDFSITGVRGSDTQFTSLPCISITGVGSPTALCRPLDQLAQVTQGYQHLFQRTTAFGAEAGLSFLRTRNDDDLAFRTVWFPNAAVTLAHREGPKGALLTQAILRLAPNINPLTGAVTNFIDGQAMLTQPITPTVLLRVAAGGGQAIPTNSPAAATIVDGEIELGFLVGKRINLAVGERAFWQRQALVPNVAGTDVPAQTAVAFADFFSTVTYFAVTVRAPELRF